MSRSDRKRDGRGREPVPFSQPADDRGDRIVEHGQRAGWIQPMALEPKRKRVRQKKSKRRCSNKGCLPLALCEYLSLLDWTGRQIRSSKRGSVPKGLRPMFERLGISSELWVECVVQFEKGSAVALADRRRWKQMRRLGEIIERLVCGGVGRCLGRLGSATHSCRQLLRNCPLQA